MEDLLRVGVIANTHGVHGEVKVFPTTDDVNRFKKLKTVKLDTGKEIKDLKITGVKFFKNMAILKFEGIDNINDIEKFLYYIGKYYIRERKIKKGVELSAIFYKFLNLCPSKYLNAKYKRRVGNVDKEFKRAEFKNFCLQYFSLAPNQYKPKDLVKVSNIEFNSYEDNDNVWDRIK